ncbi:MAG: SpoIIE family protein phosphatase [Oscillospiraceae bacterium]|nr:SpoIIE family protein phosphatase [Oscillospiraceae bacterium]
MITIQSYVRQSRHTLRRWALDPRIHTVARGGAYLLAGFMLSAASLGQSLLPLALALVCACSSWPAVLAALGSALGYRIFWNMGQQQLVWLAAGLCAALLLGDKRISRDTPLLLPAIAGLIVASSGVLFQTLNMEDTPIALYLIRVGLAAAVTWLFSQLRKGRNPILEWLGWGVAVLALVQIAPVRWFSLGFFAAGALTVVGAFPAAAMAGLALDLAQVTPVPMTAVLVLAYFIRLLPKPLSWAGRLAPGVVYLLVMWLWKTWDVLPLPALIAGAMAGGLLPVPGKVAHRRGETGVAQVRLELAAGVLSQTQELLLEIPEIPVDEDALVTRAAERACHTCPNRKGCKDTQRIGMLPGLLLHKPLLQTEELPIVCRKSGRFLAELHRSQEQLRSIRADRERQKEYRAAVVQQYQFLSEFLQELSDRLSRRTEPTAVYSPQVAVFGNRPEEDNGDRCLRFMGTEGRYYVLLCDGMGTGLGAVQEGRTAGTMLKRMLSAGYPAEHALRSINSLCALRDRAGAVTMDLAEIRLDTGRVALYKWGAVPSYLITALGAEKIGTAGPPPGLSVTDYRERTEYLTLRRGQMLVMVSDGVGEDLALGCCVAGVGNTPGELATALLTGAETEGQDDATVVIISLEPAEG